MTSSPRNSLAQQLLVSTFVSILALAIPAIVPAAAGTGGVTPASFDRGQNITITFNATGGPLAGAGAVNIHFGYNNWASSNPTDPAMTPAGANQWTYNLTMPTNYSQLDFVFNNGGGTWDNNDGADWHFVVDSEPGSTVVPLAQGGGVIFRVWAPNATAALVRGQFNGFGTGNPMSKDATTGIWSEWISTATNGQQYKYFFNGTTWRKDPRAQRVVNSSDNSIIYDTSAYNWAGDSFTMPALRDMVVYEMHPGTWNVTDGSAPATFTDLIARLNYLETLGINVIELMPVSEVPGDISGGYNLSDPYAVESAFGGPDGFKNFVKACHQREIGVVLDVVHNHYGPNDLDLYNFDSGGTGGIYFYDSPAALAESGFGPRPDYSNANVRDFIKDNIQTWLDEYHVDGFRWDFTKAIRGTLDGGFNVNAPIPEGISLLRESNDLVHTYAGKISIAEDMANLSDIVTPTSSPSGFGFDSQWTSSFHFTVVDELDDAADTDRNIFSIAGQINGSMTRMHYLESHDEVWALNNKDRVPKRISNGSPTGYQARKLSGVGAALMFASEGIPMVFQGQEWGETTRWNDGVGLDWSLYTTAPYSGVHAMYTDLVHLRRNTTGTTRGLTGDTTVNIQTFDPQKVIAWYRQHSGGQPGDTIVILANFSSTAYTSGFNIGMPLSGTWYEVFNGDSVEYGSDYGNLGVGQTVTTVANPLHGYPQRGTVFIGPYSAVMLSQVNPAVSAVDDWADIKY